MGSVAAESMQVAIQHITAIISPHGGAVLLVCGVDCAADIAHCVAVSQRSRPSLGSCLSTRLDRSVFARPGSVHTISQRTTAHGLGANGSQSVSQSAGSEKTLLSPVQRVLHSVVGLASNFGRQPCSAHRHSPFHCNAKKVYPAHRMLHWFGDILGQLPMYTGKSRAGSCALPNLAWLALISSLKQPSGGLCGSFSCL